MNTHFEHLFNEEIYVLGGQDSALGRENTPRTVSDSNATVSAPENVNPIIESVEGTSSPEVNTAHEAGKAEKTVSTEPVIEKITPPQENEKKEPVAEETSSHLKVVLTNTVLDEGDMVLLEKILAAIHVGKEDYVMKVVSSSDAVNTSSYLFYFNETVSDCIPNGNTGIMAPSLKKLATDTSQKQKLWAYMKDLLLK